mmetsp:Transcript_50752/g.100451  ORF Transcript_50752/g.100451 Transcript_50752/m.100451 type:complete len:273 (-) Transcript_50752:120-938(-)
MARLVQVAVLEQRAAVNAICGDDDELEQAIRQCVDKTADLNMRAIFHLYDKDNTGTLDSEEFTQLLTKCGVKLGKSKYQKLLHLVSGGDGLIDYKEFSKLIRTFRQEGAAIKSAERAEDKAGWLKQEAAANAVIKEREELKQKNIAARALSKSEHHKHHGHGGSGGGKDAHSAIEREKGLEKLWHKIGKYITKVMGEGDNRAEGMKLFKALFERYDTNGDGELTIEELAEGLASSGITTSRRNFKLLVADVDADGSGVISLREWTKGGKGHL